jgi:hypothetical protein
MLHWGMSREKVGNWGTPDRGFCPLDTAIMTDGLAAQSLFHREQENQSIRTITFRIQWSAGEVPIKSMSFVLMEKNKNLWHSINGKDQSVIMTPDKFGSANGAFIGVPQGPIGDIVNQIYEVEVKWERWTLACRYNKIKDLLQ